MLAGARSTNVHLRAESEDLLEASGARAGGTEGDEEGVQVGSLERGPEGGRGEAIVFGEAWDVLDFGMMMVLDRFVLWVVPSRAPFGRSLW